MIAIPNMSKPKSCKECESFYIEFYMGENKMGSACTLNDDDGSTIEADYNFCPLIEIVQCKDCKWFELDVWGELNGIPLIVAHEMCKFWGDGCKTSQDGFCSYGERRSE